MPATSTWCRGPVPTTWGSQVPATCVVRARLRALGDGGQIRAGAVPEVFAESLASLPAQSESHQRLDILTLRLIAFLLLLRWGDVELNPGPVLKCLQWNCNRIDKGKRVWLSHLLSELAVDVCLLQETHFSKVDFESFALPGFNHFGVTRERTIGGGVSILTKRDLRVAECPKVLTTELEAVTLQVFSEREEPVMISSAYIPHGDLVRRDVLDTHPLPDSCPQVIGMGANSHQSLWDATGQPNRAGLILHDWLTENFVRCANDKAVPTRHSPDGRVMTSPGVTLFAECSICDWNVISTAPSDHGAIYFTTQRDGGLDAVPPARAVAALYSFHKANWKLYRVEVANSVSEHRRRNLSKNAEARAKQRTALDPPPVVGHKRTRNGRGIARAPPPHIPNHRVTLNDRVTHITTAINKATRKHVPRGKALYRPYWTLQLTELETKIAQTNPASEEHRRLAGTFISELRQASVKGWIELCSALSSNDPRAWGMFHAIRTSRSPSNIAMRTETGFMSAQQQANAFLKLYKDKSTRHPNASLRIPPRPSTAPFKDFTLGELEMALRDVQTRSAPGPDGIYNESLKALPKRGKKALLAIYNQGVRTGHVPGAWKVGHIIPQLKPQKTLVGLSSYRPVTLTSNLCKLLERVVARRIRDQLESRPRPQQAGFRPHRSTVDPLDLILHKVVQRPLGRKVGAVFVDYARAFDSVDHGCVIAVLCKFEVDQHLSRWIMDFLDNRRTRVRLHKMLSKAGTFTCGVPQGSVLGP